VIHARAVELIRARNVSPLRLGPRRKHIVARNFVESSESGHEHVTSREYYDRCTSLQRLEGTGDQPTRKGGVGRTRKTMKVSGKQTLTKLQKGGRQWA